MPYNLIDIAVTERRPHPILGSRILGTVRAVLHEAHDWHNQDHSLSLKVWTEADEQMSDDDINMALLLKAASVIGRVKANLERSDATLFQPAATHNQVAPEDALDIAA